MAKNTTADGEDQEFLVIVGLCKMDTWKVDGTFMADDQLNTEQYALDQRKNDIPSLLDQLPESNSFYFIPLFHKIRATI